MNLHIISWNVRDLNDWEKRRRVHNSLRMWKGDVVCLQKTKMESISTGVV
jgi:exonuclease III